jgi:hypothetical protein
MSTADHSPTALRDEQWALLASLLLKPLWNSGALDSCLMSADACFMAFSLSTRPSAKMHDSQGFGNW